MGYTFKIGEARCDPGKAEDGILEARWVVDLEDHANAPTFPNDGMSSNTNSRSPSYTAWCEFCLETGVWPVFYRSVPPNAQLRAGHPGCQVITQDELDLVRVKLAEWRAKSTLPPGFAGYTNWDPIKKEWYTPDEGKYDHQLARLIWLEWWMTRAINTCKVPAIQNT